jgi:hypothetical protein
MVFVLGIWYSRKAENEFDPLADAVAAAGAADAETGRFERGEPRREAVR